MRNDDSLRRRVHESVEYLATRNDELRVRVQDAIRFHFAPILIEDFRQPGTRELAERIRGRLDQDGGTDALTDASAVVIAEALVALDSTHRPLFDE